MSIGFGTNNSYSVIILGISSLNILGTSSYKIR
jgi:hypothetical protein